MKREEIKHLLGGYAAGTLTPSEQEMLFARAMEDQELFDALADEQSLKEILDDPEARSYLLAALEEVEPRVKVEERKKPAWNWWWSAAGLSAVAATLALVTMVGIQRSIQTRESMSAKPVEMAAVTKSDQPPAPAVPEVAAPSSPAAARPRAVVQPPKAQVGRSSDEGKAEEVGKRLAIAKDAERDNLTDKKAKEVVVDRTPALAAASPAAAPPPAPPRPPEVQTESRREAVEPVKSQTPADMERAAGAGQEQKQQQQVSASQLYLTQFRQQQTQAPSGQAVGGLASGMRAKAPTAMRKAAPPPPQQQQQSQPMQNVGIRYQILRRNTQGQFVETRLDTRFEAGDEIVIKAGKNAGGIVTVLQITGAGSTAIPMASQTLLEAATAPIRLEKGVLDLRVVLTRDGADVRADSLGPARGLVSERSGESVYVVEPGENRGPVAAQIRINVN